MLLQIRHALTLLGWSPQLHVVGFAGLEQIAGFLARHQPGGRPPNVAGLEAVPLGRLEIDFDPDLGDVVLEVRGVLADTGDLAEDGVDLLGLFPEELQVLAEDADGDGVAGAGQDLPDPLLQVREHVAEDPRVAIDDAPDAGDRLVVVHGPVDADPVLPEIDTVGLVPQQRVADVGARVPHAGDGQ
jgi:hypothetical protein